MKRASITIERLREICAEEGGKDEEKILRIFRALEQEKEHYVPEESFLRFLIQCAMESPAPMSVLDIMLAPI